jgi:hypothetical protein
MISRTPFLDEKDPGLHIREAINLRLYIAYSRTEDTESTIIFFDKKTAQRKQKQIKNKENKIAGIDFLLEGEL